MRRILTTLCLAGIGMFGPTLLHADEHDAICESTTPIVSLAFQSRYSADDPERATLDPESEADVLEALAPLDGFIDHLSVHAGRLYRGRPPERRQAALCIVERLGYWARKDALSSLGTETVKLTIGSRLASFALLFWQASPYVREHEDFDVIVAWLERRIAEQMSFWDRAPDGARVGNLRAWAALGGAAASLVSDRGDLAEWAEASVTEVLCTAEEDGSLPQEMSRGKLALHYQMHAVAPLVTASALLERQGISMQSRCDGALHRVVGFVVGDITGENRAERITGEAQTLDQDANEIANYQLAWIEPYLHLADNADIDALVSEKRPLNYTKLGGNQTALWGR